MRNVLGKIEGKKKDEIVIVGAHYNHLGYNPMLDRDKIYNGAAAMLKSAVPVPCLLATGSARTYRDFRILGRRRKRIARFEVFCTGLSGHQKSEGVSEFRHDRP